MSKKPKVFAFSNGSTLPEAALFARFAPTKIGVLVGIKVGFSPTKVPLTAHCHCRGFGGIGGGRCDM